MWKKNNKCPKCGSKRISICIGGAYESNGKKWKSRHTCW